MAAKLFFKSRFSANGVYNPTKIKRLFLSYIQGQSPRPNIREYFYYIDHQGQLFMDDARIKNFTSCFKEKQFLEFFFKRLKLNDTGSYENEFPYFSPCGRERNYVRCDDLPIVFTQVLNDIHNGGNDRLSYGGAGELLTVPFEPEKVCMLPETGRIYHPGPEKVCGVGLIKSSIAIEMSKYFEFDTECQTNPPVSFTWRGKTYRLSNEILDVMQEECHRKGVLNKT